PYADGSFDCVFAGEVLEHCIYIEGALKELRRVVKPDGCLVVIDKNVEMMGALRLDESEQWFATEKVRKILAEMGGRVTAYEGVPCEGRNDKLFTAWIAEK
ncbi:MAG: methyltransferase domain-containing protein, partial [Desulfovibrio sp.]|nr:methyltransferase domain-containing protein [Desulfovibrio sp.]